MPWPKKTMPVSALLLAPLIALSLACAPIAAATPEQDEHCARLKKSVDALGPNDDGLPAQKTVAQYQIHCLGSARPSVGQLVRTARLAAHPDHPDHPDHPAHP